MSRWCSVPVNKGMRGLDTLADSIRDHQSLGPSTTRRSCEGQAVDRKAQACPLHLHTCLPPSPDIYQEPHLLPSMLYGGLSCIYLTGLHPWRHSIIKPRSPYGIKGPIKRCWPFAGMRQPTGSGSGIVTCMLACCCCSCKLGGSRTPLQLFHIQAPFQPWVAGL